MTIKSGLRSPTCWHVPLAHSQGQLSTALRAQAAIPPALPQHNAETWIRAVAGSASEDQERPALAARAPPPAPVRSQLGLPQGTPTTTTHLLQRAHLASHFTPYLATP